MRLEMLEGRDFLKNVYIAILFCMFLYPIQFLQKNLVFRIVGLCLLQNELCPLFLNRHVVKFILGRPIKFHDMAFFDPVMYESFRQLILDAESKDSEKLFASMELTFR